MSAFDKTCPSCKERLNIHAKRCVCGWEESGGKVSEWNHVCTWHSGPLFCTYPVGRFDHGMRSGRCIFHRTHGDGVQAARIAEESRGHTQHGYIDRANLFAYGSKAAREEVTRKAPEGPRLDARGAGVDEFRQAVSGLGEALREPGADEQEVAA